MKPVENASVIDESVWSRKVAGRPFFTNWFARREQVEHWIKERAIRLFESDGVSIVVCWDWQCDRAFFAASDTALLESSLVQLKRQLDRPIVVDVVGRLGEIEQIAPVLKRAGFVSACLLKRMTAARTAAVPTENAVQIEPATADDISWIAESLISNFDVLTEQVPDIGEMRRMVDAGNVFVARAGRQPGGFLNAEWSDRQASIRRLFVASAFRRQGIASALLRHGADVIWPSATRVLLWVRTDNPGAVAFYQSAGFSDDGLHDQVMIAS